MKINDKCPYTKEQLKNAYLYTLNEEAMLKRMKISKEQYYKWLIMYDILNNNSQIDKLTPELLYEEYVINNRTINYIRNNYHISFKNLKKMMEDNNIKANGKENNINDDKFYQYYIVENHSRDETIKYFNISESYFRKYVKEKEFKKVKSNNGIRHNKPTKEELYQKYIVENMFQRELAIYYNTNIRTINRWLQGYFIKKMKK